MAGRWEFLRRFLDDADDGRRDQRAVARERGLRVAMIATTLGPRLSRHWSAGDVVHLVERYGLAGRYAEARTVIGAGDAHSPLRYLACVLDRALTNPAALVPHPSPVRQAFERDVLAAERATDAARAATLRAELDQRDAAAAAERAGPGTARAAARAAAAAAAARQARPGDSREPTTARADRAEPVDDGRHRPDRGGLLAASDPDGWPAVAQPGSGQPDG